MEETVNLFLASIAQKDGIAIQTRATLRESFRLMHANGEGAVVMLEGDRPLGILTERDAVRLLHDGHDLEEEAGPFTRKTLITASGRRTIGYALNLMLENNIRRLVVVDDDDAFAGLVTQKDLLRHMEEDYFRSSLKVKHIVDAARPLLSVGRGDTIHAALERMVGSNISAVPVLGPSGEPLGIITEKDILNLANAEVPLDSLVDSHMSSPVISAGPEDRLVGIVETMKTRNIRRVLICDGDGRASAIITNRDILRNLEGSYNDFLEKRLTYTKGVLNLLPEMLLEVIDTGREQLVLWANEKSLSAFGCQVLDRPVTDIVPPDRWEVIHRTLLARTRVENVRFKRGDAVYEFSGFYLPLDKISEKGRIQLILRDITEEILMATTDPLTSLYNRRYMNDFMQREIERSRRASRSFAVVMADLDDFKRVNDRYGHLAGDRVLKEVVGLLSTSTRNYDVVGRYGGEEFLVIMPEIDHNTASLVTERIRAAIQNHGMEPVRGERLAMTASFGLALYSRDGDSPDDLLVRADQRLYQAKERGKNCVVAS